MSDSNRLIDEKPLRTVHGICSNKPRPSVQNGREHTATTGHCFWGKDVWHIRRSGMSTICGRDTSGWLDMGFLNPDWHLCSRCEKAGKKQGLL